MSSVVIGQLRVDEFGIDTPRTASATLVRRQPLVTCTFDVPATGEPLSVQRLAFSCVAPKKRSD